MTHPQSEAHLDQWLPKWRELSESEARAACKALAPELRRDTLRAWWSLCVMAPDPKALKAEIKKPKRSAKSADKEG